MSLCGGLDGFVGDSIGSRVLATVSCCDHGGSLLSRTVRSGGDNNSHSVGVSVMGLMVR